MRAKRRLDQFRRPRRDLGDAPGLVSLVQRSFVEN
jgi:hypothetical protein